MKTVNIHKAKTNLSKLIEQAVNGEPFIIANAGKPLVKVTRIDAPIKQKKLGFMLGQLSIPEDFDTLGADKINQLFNESK
jgi:prevent-host-death family protein